jgi:hypothetical protein
MLDPTLRSMQSMTRICGVLQKNNARDAYLLALCTASVPDAFSITTPEPHGGWKASDFASIKDQPFTF